MDRDGVADVDTQVLLGEPVDQRLVGVGRVGSPALQEARLIDLGVERGVRPREDAEVVVRLLGEGHGDVERHGLVHGGIGSQRLEDLRVERRVLAPAAVPYCSWTSAVWLASRKRS